MSKQSTLTIKSQRRRSLRVHLDAVLHASISGAQPGSAHVRDLAIGGAFLETEQSFSVGESIYLEIFPTSNHFACEAVVRSASPLGIGIEFVKMSSEEREHLRIIMAGLLA